MIVHRHGCTIVQLGLPCIRTTHNYANVNAIKMKDRWKSSLTPESIKSLALTRPLSITVSWSTRLVHNMLLRVCPNTDLTMASTSAKPFNPRQDAGIHCLCGRSSFACYPKSSLLHQNKLRTYRLVFVWITDGKVHCSCMPVSIYNIK